MTLPASGIVIESGSHDDTLDLSGSPSGPIPMPTKSRMTPPMESGVATARANREALESVTPAPRAMQTQPAITVLSRLFEPMGASFTGAGRGRRVSASLGFVDEWRVQVRGVGVLWYASVAQLGRASDL